jgi:hypothetical protein
MKSGLEYTWRITAHWTVSYGAVCGSRRRKFFSFVIVGLLVTWAQGRKCSGKWSVYDSWLVEGTCLREQGSELHEKLWIGNFVLNVACMLRDGPGALLGETNGPK